MNTQLRTLWLLVLVGGLVLMNGHVCSAALTDGPPPNVEVIREAAADYFPDQHQQYHISANELYALLHDGDQSTDPLIVSVQTRAEYELGHIPGAINVPWDEITDIAQLQAKIDKDQLTVIYCNRCVYSAQMSVILNLLGYNTLDLAYGFESWTQNKFAIPNHFDPDCVCEHTLDTETHIAKPTGEYPQLKVTGDTPEEVITAAANAYLASDRYNDLTNCPCDLEELLIDEDPANDPFVLSLQWPKDYAKGHIPSAVNIPRWELFKTENLSRLPTDRPIISCCYLGYTSAQVVAILNMMGYDARVSEHGLSAWTLDPEITLFRIDDSRNWRDYPIAGTAACAAAARMSPAGPLPVAQVAEEIVCPNEYIVKRGDNLSRLSKKYCGNPRLYRGIVMMTNTMHELDDSFAKITNPSHIRTGWKLCLPNDEFIQ